MKGTESTENTENTEGLKVCPFCGSEMEKCDYSPIYGQTIMHPEAECIFSGNLIFHERAFELWNMRQGCRGAGLQGCSERELETDDSTCRPEGLQSREEK